MGRKRSRAHDPQHALMDDGDIMCHPTLVLPFLQDFEVDNARVGEERTPLKTRVIYNMNDLGAAPPEWKIDDVKKMAETSTVTDGSITLGVAVGPRQYIVDQLWGKADVIRAMHERVQLCQDPQTEFALLRESLGSAAPTTSCGFTPPQSCRNRGLQRPTTRSGSGLSNGSSRASQRTALRKQPSARATQERETSLLHIWEPSSQPNRASRL